MTRETDGVAPNSGDAVKFFVDANITITPDGPRTPSATHTFTVNVFQDDGRAAADPGATVSMASARHLTGRSSTST